VECLLAVWDMSCDKYLAVEEKYCFLPCPYVCILKLAVVAQLWLLLNR
jgi:hypothetical protein